MIRCPQCQTEVAEGKRFCPNCGTRMPDAPVAPPPAPATPDIGRTVLLPPESDAAKTMLVPPEPDTAQTMLVPPEPAPAGGAEPPSSAGQQTILAGPPPTTPPSAGGFGLPPTPPPSGGGYGLPPTPPPAAPPSGGGFGLPATPPPTTPPAAGGYSLPTPPPTTPPAGGGFTVPSAGGAAPVAAPPAKKGMNIWMILGIIVGVVVLLCVIVGAIGVYFVQQAGTSLGTAVAGTAISFEQPSFTAEFPNVLEEDGLDSESSGMFSAETTDFADYRYENGAYVIEVADPEFIAWQMISGVRDDIAFSIDATIDGPRDTAATLLFRYQDQNNFYSYSVNGNGEYRVLYYENDEPTVLVDWTSSSAINSLGQSNNLRIEMNGDTLTFFCNDRELTTLSDSTFSSGELGFATETFADGNGTVAFDNLLVRGR